MNRLFKEIGQSGGNPQMNQFMQNFQQFQKTITGNPREQVQQLLNSGKVTQAQYDHAVKMANNLKKMLGM